MAALSWPLLGERGSGGSWQGKRPHGTHCQLAILAGNVQRSAGVCVSVLVLNAGTCAGAAAAGVRTGAVDVRVLVLVASLLVLVRLVCVLVLKLQVRGT